MGTPDQQAYMASEPELNAGSWALLRVFVKLSTERQIGMGVGPIPIRVIWEWLDREGVWDAELRDFIESVLMGVDALVSTRMRNESEAKRPAPKEPAPQANRPPAKKRRR